MGAQKARPEIRVSRYRRGGAEALVGGVAIGASVTLTIRPIGSLEGVLESEGAAIPDEFRVLISNRETGFSRGTTVTFGLARGASVRITAVEFRR